MLFAESMIDSNTDIPTMLKTVVIGSGFADRVQLHALKAHPAIQVTAIASRTEAHIKAVAERHGVPTYYTDWEKMLETEQPDLVSIVTPPAFHKKMALAAFEAGAHVICEKPMAMNVAETQAMLAAAQQHKKVHIVNHEFRYIPARYYQKVLLDQGYVGEPLLLEGTQLSGWRRDPNAEWDWWVDESLGGGMYGALGSHYIDGFRWWLDDEVETITGQLRYPFKTRPDSTGSPKKVTADEGASMLMTMRSGVNAILNLSSVASGESKRLAIHGTHGALVVENDRKLLGRTKDEKELHPIDIPNDYVPPHWQMAKQLLTGPFYQLVDLAVEQIFGRAIDDPRLVPATFEDGIAVQKVLDAGRKSHSTGERITIS